MRYAGFLTLSALLLTAAAPAPLQSGGGWSTWEWRMGRIREAILTHDLNLLDATCSGMRDTLNKSGFHFPKWADSMRFACPAIRNMFEGSDNRRRTHIVCKDLKNAARDLSRATEVAEAPRADNTARDMGQLLTQLHETVCK